MAPDNVFIRLADLPETVKAITVPSCDGFNVYVNSKYTCEVQKEACQHEIEHIQQNHFYRNSDVLILENEADMEEAKHIESSNILPKK